MKMDIEQRLRAISIREKRRAHIEGVLISATGPEGSWRGGGNQRGGEKKPLFEVRSPFPKFRGHVEVAIKSTH